MSSLRIIFDWEWSAFSVKKLNVDAIYLDLDERFMQTACLKIEKFRQIGSVAPLWGHHCARLH